jgi:hypothetical protein
LSQPIDPARRWTRARLLRATLGGATVVAGGAATASWTGGGAPAAAPSANADVEILNLFLLLEQVQQSFYGDAIRKGRLDAELERFASTVGAQEEKHVALLTKRLGRHARSRPRSDFGAAVTDPKQFQDAAIMLEESTIAAFISQGANLTRDALAAVVPLVSVEARQAAWLRDLAGVSPAPRAADPARNSDEIIADLRRQGFIQ